MKKKEFTKQYREKFPERNVISIWQSKKYNYFVVKELMSGEEFGCDPWEIESAYDENFLYLSTMKTALRLTKKYGITEFGKASETDNIASIGFNPVKQTWYGWSHRAIFGFGIGSEVKKGDCAYHASNIEDFAEDCVAFWSDRWHEEPTGEITSQTDEETGEIVYGVLVSWKYSNDVPNEKLRGEITGIFTRFPKVFGRGEWKAETLEDAKLMAKDFAEGVS